MITSFKLDLIDEILNKRLRPWITENERSDRYYCELFEKENPVPMPNGMKFQIGFRLHLLFTFRVRYYVRLIDNAVANHLQQAFDTIDNDGSKQLTRYVLKVTRESVETLISDAVDHCQTLSVKPDDLSDFIDNRKEKEYYVILHYLIAALVRCWIEMQEHYQSVLNTSERYDIKSFYASKVGWVEDPIAQVEPNNKKDNNGLRKTIKKTKHINKRGYISSTFTYKGYKEDNYSIQRLDLITKDLMLFVESNTKKQLLKNMFTGASFEKEDKITWTGTQTELAYFFRQIHIHIDFSGDNYWEIVASRFIIKTKNKKKTRIVAISADKLKSNTQKPKPNVKKKLDDIIYYFSADLTKLVGQYSIDNDENADRFNDMSKEDYHWENRKRE